MGRTGTVREQREHVGWWLLQRILEHVTSDQCFGRGQEFDHRWDQWTRSGNDADFRRERGGLCERSRRMGLAASQKGSENASQGRHALEDGHEGHIVDECLEGARRGGETQYSDGERWG